MFTTVHIDAPPMSPDAPDTHTEPESFPAPCLYEYTEEGDSYVYRKTIY